MSIENPLWGAPRIHGELLKLGFEVAQSSVAKYMVKRRGPPNLKDRREPAIKLDKEPAIAVCESNTATQLAPQNNQLMSKRRILSFKPQLRLEWRGQDGKSETEQPDHFASLGDFITSSTRISFRYTQPTEPGPRRRDSQVPEVWGGAMPR
jgi:hypothetical protein